MNTAIIQTASGALVDLAHPDPAAVDIRDIAHSLARVCRFGGHVRPATGPAWYSVAQHSLLVEHLTPAPLAMVALLHDATEAYLGDVTAPLKALLGAVYLDLERGWALAIGQRFGLGAALAELPPEVAAADRRALATERRDMVAPSSWRVDAEPHPARIAYLAPEFACDAFLNRFDVLSGGGR